MFIKKVFLITFIATIFSSCCYANNNDEVLNTENEDIYIPYHTDVKEWVMHLLPIDTINNDPDNSQIKYSWEINVRNKTSGYDTERILYRINCLKKKIRVLSYATYRKNYLLFLDTKSRDINYSPNSIMEQYLKIVCKTNRQEIINSYKDVIVSLPKDPGIFIEECLSIINIWQKL